ncbi:MAG: RluA family pseudouridine synthase [Bdellovibrio sp.]|nr:MAG: RluA family pseudouridine synthase [Bdellovibrio sp.]
MGLRIDKALGGRSEIGSRSRAEQLIEAGRVRLHCGGAEGADVVGRAVKPSHRIQEGESFVIEVPAPVPVDLQPFEFSLETVYEDDDLLIIDKPAGLVVHPAAGHATDTLVNALIHRGAGNPTTNPATNFSTNSAANPAAKFAMKFGEQRPGIVHRLDKDTSGLLVIAKNDRTQRALVEQFKSRRIHRRYQAVVWSSNLPERGTIKSFLARHPANRKKFSSVRDSRGHILRDSQVPPSVGKWAVTHFQVAQRAAHGLARLQVQLETGRTHQIRVHLSEMGAAILTDPIYGRSSRQMTTLSKEQREIVEQIPRLCLHAEELGFLHPTSHKELFFKSGWPADLEFWLKRLLVL